MDLRRKVFGRGTSAETIRDTIAREFYNLDTDTALSVLAAMGWKIDRQNLYFFLKKEEIPAPPRVGRHHAWGPSDIQAVADFLAARPDAENWMKPFALFFQLYGIDFRQFVEAKREAGAPLLPFGLAPEGFRLIVEPFRRDRAEVRFEKVGGK
jgi:hypothetical protein